MTAIEALISNHREECCQEEADAAQVELENLRAKLHDMERLVQALSVDPAFQILSRPAIMHEMGTKAAFARYVIFADIDHMHDANARFGYEAVNQRIAKAVNLRAGDVLLRGRWFSGDELVFVLGGNNPDGFCSRLQRAFEKDGLKVSLLYQQFSGDLESDIAKLSTAMQRQKALRDQGKKGR